MIERGLVQDMVEVLRSKSNMVCMRQAQIGERNFCFVLCGVFGGNFECMSCGIAKDRNAGPSLVEPGIESPSSQNTSIAGIATSASQVWKMESPQTSFQIYLTPLFLFSQTGNQKSSNLLITISGQISVPR